MMLASNLLTILAMAAATYSTRLAGYLLLRGRTLSRRARAVMDAAPGCVFVALIAPYLATSRPADAATVLVTAAVAVRLPMLPTIALAMASAGLLRAAS